MRLSAASLSASKRNTTTGVVFEARARPKPSAYSTRRPSRRMTSVAPGNSAVSASLAISACGGSPLLVTLSSGVEMLSGSACNAADGSARRERISSSRAPAYRPSSKPYQRSLKNVWPLISPASSAPLCFIFALINECPVFHNSGVPRDPGLEVARRFDVIDHRRARIAREQVGGEEHQLSVRIDNASVAGHDAEPVAVAVERQAQLPAGRRHGADQVLQVLRLRRV